MSRTLSVSAILAVSLLVPVATLHAQSPAPASDSQAPAQTPADQYRAVVNKYCVTCHNEKLKTADLILSKADIASPANDGEIFEKVIRKLRARAMPPAGAPRPDSATYDGFASYLETELDRAAAAHPNPGRP